MKTIYTRTKFETFPYLATSRYNNRGADFSKVWKKLVKQEIERKKAHKPGEYYQNHIAPLTILRNMILGRSVYTGFTPKLRHKQLANGNAWNGGWTMAYDSLHAALGTGTNVTSLTIKCYELILAARGYSFHVPKLADYLIKPSEFWGYTNLANYFSQVNSMLATQMELTPKLREKLKTYEDVMDYYDAVKKFNILTEEQFLKREHGHARFQKILDQFAYDWLKLTNRAKDFALQSVSIVESDSLSWLYEPMQYDNPQDSYEAHSVIKIVTKARRETIIGEPEVQVTENDQVFYLPVKYLWEVEWIEDEERV